MFTCDWPGMSPLQFVIVPSLAQVLRNDVLSHHATVNTVNSAAAELLESSPGDEASHLRDQLDQLNQSWQSLLLKTEERKKLLEAALQQVLHWIPLLFILCRLLRMLIFLSSPCPSAVCLRVGRRFPWRAGGVPSVAEEDRQPAVCRQANRRSTRNCQGAAPATHGITHTPTCSCALLPDLAL